VVNENKLIETEELFNEAKPIAFESWMLATTNQTSKRLSCTGKYVERRYHPRKNPNLPSEAYETFPV